MRLVDLQMGFPSLLLALFVLYVLGAGVWNVILVLAITRWMVYARVTRGLVLSYRENVFVEAARATGCTDRRIIFLHMLPNLLSPILVLATLEVAHDDPDRGVARASWGSASSRRSRPGG